MKRSRGLPGDGPSQAELDRVLTQAEAHFLYRLQTVGGFGGKSDQMNAYNVMLGTPAFFEADLARYRAVTPARLRQSVAKHLSTPRVSLSVVPHGRGRLAAPSSEPAVVE